MDEIIIIGSGGHALSCIDVIKKENRFEIAGLIDNIDKKEVNGFPIIGNDDSLEKLRKKYRNAFIAVGFIKDPSTRIRLEKILKSLNYTMPTIISPLSYISSSSVIEEGSIIMHGSIVNADVKIGKNCIINSCSLIEHGANIANNCHISTGVIINGDVKVGSETFIGSGSIVKNGISISNNKIIGIGSIVSKNI